MLTLKLKNVKMKSSPFRYQAPSNEPSAPCVFKLWFGKKFLIWKAKALMQSLDQVAAEVDRGIRLGPREGNAFAKAAEYARKGRITIFTVEIMLSSDKPVALLRSEYLLLKKHFNSDDCLNVMPEPHIPKWIPQEDVLSFNKWKQQLNKKKKNESDKPKKSKDDKNISTRGVTKEVSKSAIARRKRTEL